MWISRERYDRLLTDNARLQAEAEAAKGKLEFLFAQYEALVKRHDELWDTVQMATGLKPRPPKAKPEAEGELRSGDGENRQYNVHRTPSQALADMQRKYNTAALAEENAKIQAAIKVAEEELKLEKIASNT